MYYHIENGYIITQKHETFVMIWVLIEDKVEKVKMFEKHFFFWKLSRKCSREVPVFTSLFETADGKQWMVTLHQIILQQQTKIIKISITINPLLQFTATFLCKNVLHRSKMGIKESTPYSPVLRIHTF